MSKLLSYDLKRNSRGIFILSFISLAFFVVLFLTQDIYRVEEDASGNNYYVRLISLVGIHNFIFIVISILMPFFILKFKMRKVTVDQMYSLPIKREHLYLEKYLFGLICIFIPYTLSMLGAHLTALFNPNIFNVFPNFYYVIPAYFAVGLLLIIFYTLSCFFFTRCNSMLDGILVSLAAILFLSLLGFAILLGNSGGAVKATYDIINKLNIIYLANFLGTSFNCLIENENLKYITDNWDLFIYLGIYVVIAGLAFYAYLHFNKQSKAENTTGISRSYFAYRLWIPLYAVAGGLLIPNSSFAFFSIMVVVIVFIYLGILIHLRSVKLTDKIYIAAYGAFAVGLLLKLLLL